MLRTHPIRVAALGAIAAALVAAAADGPTQDVDAGGLTFKAPKDWKSSKPKSAMRRAELVAPPAKGDKDPAELIVYAFPGNVGGVDANIKRWEGQFQGKDGQPPKAKVEKRKGQNVDVTVVEIAGRYVAAVTPGGPDKLDKADYRLLGAIVQAGEGSYFLKMIGPDKTMTEAKSAFDDLVRSMKVGK